MGDSSAATDGSPSVHERNVLEGDSSPKLTLLQTIADLEGVDETELPAIYPCIGEMVERFYSDPPSSEAQAQLEFTYHDYRITLVQDGMAILQKTA